MNQDPTEELTLAAAAREIGYTRQNLSHAVQAGLLPARRVAGTVVLVKRADAMAYKDQPKNRGGRGRKTKTEAKPDRTEPVER